MNYLSILQGGYFLLTGIWPLLSIRTFEMITGPKNDHWLVKTVGVVVAVIGAVLIIAGLRQQVTPEIILLGLGSAAGLGGIDVNYASKGVISKIYLADAVVEAGIIALWAGFTLFGI